VLDVQGTVDDVTTGGYEAITAGRAPARWPVVDRFVLVHLEPGVGEARVARAVKPLLAPGTRLRVRVQGENPFLRYGDAVLPQMVIKKVFGEFAARPLPDGRIAIDGAWLRRNIRTARVPILGEVTCHRALVGQLRAALAAVRTESLAHTINGSQFGGCFAPRFVNARPNTRLSHHSWGIAVDINVAENPFGARPSQDKRLVEIMADHGYTWGGTWLIPDGMHFEWVDFP
jgi:hypothetical protein